jgi:AcrR family transcriptional regulator
VPEVPVGQKPSEGDQGRRGRRRSTRSHQAVLTATIAVLDDVGYSALTIEAVAAAAGVGKATIYRWWPSRASLVIEALETTVPAPRTASTGDTRADVRAIVQAAVDDYIHTPLGPNLAVIAADAVTDPDAADRLAALLGARRAAHASVLLAAAGRGDLPHDIDVHLLLDIITGTLVHRALLGVAPDAHTIDQLADLIVTGTPPRAAPRRAVDTIDTPVV